ncbi:lipoprotein [Erwinia tracheiphila]|nr:lipoprotein [Erwinia tracheiphila]UIA83431.1 lipoprotein [Erwinia tracheiphila]UIA92011.1 lipoprotein [Erwinia tracheiphila]
MSRTSMNRTIYRMALLLAVTSLAGCGLKGPLYFPPPEQPQKQTSTGSKSSATKAQQPAASSQRRRPQVRTTQRLSNDKAAFGAKNAVLQDARSGQ